MLHHFHRCRIVNQPCFLVLFPTHEILIFHGPYTCMVSMVSTADLVCVCVRGCVCVVGYGPSESMFANAHPRKWSLTAFRLEKNASLDGMDFETKVQSNFRSVDSFNAQTASSAFRFQSNKVFQDVPFAGPLAHTPRKFCHYFGANATLWSQQYYPSSNSHGRGVHSQFVAIKCWCTAKVLQNVVPRRHFYYKMLDTPAQKA